MSDGWRRAWVRIEDFVCVDRCGACLPDPSGLVCFFVRIF